MLCKLIVEGKEFDIEIMDPELQKLVAPKKRTGYEVDEEKHNAWTVDAYDDVVQHKPLCDDKDAIIYKIANYYSDKTVAKNNARADRLMRKLRRFAVEHRKKDIDWNNFGQLKYAIDVDYASKDVIYIATITYIRDFANIYFDTKEAAELAIEEFYDELIWYFTEYKDSL